MRAPAPPRHALSRNALARPAVARRALLLTVANLLAVVLVLPVSPARASALGDQRFGPAIEGYSRYQAQTECVHKEQPGVAAFRDLVLAEHPGRDGGIVRACGIGGRSEHKEGRAWDWMVNVRDADERAAADEVVAWLLVTDEHGNEHANARRLGIMYVIWDRQIWSATRADEGWRPYRGPDPHTDHVHVSFNRPGARGETSFWQPAGSRVLASAPTPPVVSVVRRPMLLHDSISWLLEARYAGR
jgi:hypothetical protein